MSSTAEVMQHADEGSCTHPEGTGQGGSPLPVVLVGNHLLVIACWAGGHSGSENGARAGNTSCAVYYSGSEA